MDGAVIELFPMKPEEAPLFFSSLDKAEDKARGCIGHMRGDFDGRLHTSWWPHYWDQALNREPFKQDIQRVVDLSLIHISEPTRQYS